MTIKDFKTGQKIYVLYVNNPPLIEVGASSPY